MKMKLFPSDDNESYFHIFYKDSKKSAEREKMESKIDDIAMFIEQHEWKKHEFSKAFEKYFSVCQCQDIRRVRGADYKEQDVYLLKAAYRKEYQEKEFHERCRSNQEA